MRLGVRFSLSKRIDQMVYMHSLYYMFHIPRRNDHAHTDCS